jgi:hypothetical protein
VWQVARLVSPASLTACATAFCTRMMGLISSTPHRKRHALSPIVAQPLRNGNTAQKICLRDDSHLRVVLFGCKIRHGEENHEQNDFLRRTPAQGGAAAASTASTSSPKGIATRRSSLSWRSSDWLCWSVALFVFRIIR